MRDGYFEKKNALLSQNKSMEEVSSKPNKIMGTVVFKRRGEFGGWGWKFQRKNGNFTIPIPKWIYVGSFIQIGQVSKIEGNLEKVSS